MTTGAHIPRWVEAELTTLGCRCREVGQTLVVFYPSAVESRVLNLVTMAEAGSRVVLHSLAALVQQIRATGADANEWNGQVHVLDDAGEAVPVINWFVADLFERQTREKALTAIRSYGASAEYHSGRYSVICHPDVRFKVLELLRALEPAQLYLRTYDDVENDLIELGCYTKFIGGVLRVTFPWSVYDDVLAVTRHYPGQIAYVFRQSLTVPGSADGPAPQPPQPPSTSPVPVGGPGVPPGDPGGSSPAAPVGAAGPATDIVTLIGGIASTGHDIAAIRAVPMFQVPARTARGVPMAPLRGDLGGKP